VRTRGPRAIFKSPSDVLRSSALFQPVRNPELHAVRVGLGELGRAAVLTDVLAIMAPEAVTPAHRARPYFVGGRELEALFHAALGLQFRHFILQGSASRRTQKRPPRHAVSPGHPKSRGS